VSGEVAALRVPGGDRITKGQAMPDGNKSGAIEGQKAENADTPNSDAKGGQTSSEYAPVPVTTDVSDGDCIEITSGLQEGDTVVYIPTSSSSQDFAMIMPGGMPSGGSMPAGGGGRVRAAVVRAASEEGADMNALIEFQ